MISFEEMERRAEDHAKILWRQKARERRERIATHVLAGLLAGKGAPSILEHARTAVHAAAALIAELDKEDANVS